MLNQSLFEDKQLACSNLREQFLNAEQGLANVLQHTLDPTVYIHSN